MAENKNKGVFVVIEGGDGCGKSTLIQGLKMEFPNALFLREPGGTLFGEKVRELILNNAEISKLTEMLLFASSRSELVEKVIIPTLNEGKMIICDRFVYSSYVYQGMCTDIGLNNVEEVNNLALRGVKPDLVIFLKVSKSLRDGIENRLDIQSEEQSKKIYDSYDYLANRDKSIKVIEIDGKSIDDVRQEAKRLIMESLKNARQKDNKDIAREC